MGSRNPMPWAVHGACNSAEMVKSGD